MSFAQVLVLTQKAEVKVAKVSLGDDTILTLKHIQSYYKKKAELEVLGTYVYKNLTLFLFGYTKGKAGTENKHELPPPHDTTVAFGDIIIIASKDENSFAEPLLFKVDDYEQFYSKVFGGFEEEEEEAEEEEEELPEEEEPVEEEIGEEFEVASHVSEEVIEVKKEKKKKSSAAQNINFAQYISPEKQLNASSHLNTIRIHVVQNIKKLFSTILDCDTLENEIYLVVLQNAEDRHIVRDWGSNTFVCMYKSYVRKIIGNLYENSYIKNNELLQRYIKKEFTFKEICAMNHYELFKSKWSNRIEHQKLIEKRQIEGNKSMATDQFLCKRCHKRECTYYEMQTRSADEPMTIFINCLNCGQNWRQ